MSIRKLFRIPEGYKITEIGMDEQEINVHIDDPYRRNKNVCSGCGKIHE